MAEMLPRKVFLDWLRVCAFVVLIAFHTGLLYSDWPYNLKSPRILPTIDWALAGLTPWRLALLFFVSGAASRHLLAKLGPGAFARDRVRRLLPVILIGMFVVIPPQTYVELVDKGLLDTGYLEFWFGTYLAADQSLVAPIGKTMPTWDHLWFIVYLLAYLLALASIAHLFSQRGTRRKRVMPRTLLILAPAAWLGLAEATINHCAPLTHAFIDDWGGHLKWVGMFVTGLTCAFRTDFWEWCELRRVRLCAISILSLVALTTARFLLSNSAPGSVWSTVALSLMSGIYAWSVICTFCGYAQRYLNAPSQLLSHANESVLPVYVLHQPILLVAAWSVFPLGLPIAFEAGLLFAITLLGSLVIYETLIRPWPVVRPLFGLKSTGSGKIPEISAGRGR